MIKQLGHSVIFVSILGSIAACASAPGSGGAPPPDRDSIQLEEIRTSNAGNAYLLIEALRPQWLGMRNPSIPRGARRVYLDEAFLGNMNALRQISRATIGSIHFYDGPQATQKWGEDHAAGVIQIRTIR